MKERITFLDRQAHIRGADFAASPDSDISKSFRTNGPVYIIHETTRRPGGTWRHAPPDTKDPVCLR